MKKGFMILALLACLQPATHMMQAADGGGGARLVASGSIEDAGTPVSGVTVNAFQLAIGGGSHTTVSNSSTGTNYSFNNLVAGSTVITPVAGTSTANYRNGVDGFDIISIGLLLNNAFASPRQLMAADVNGDGQITQADQFVINDLLLFNTPFPNGVPSWRFIDASTWATISYPALPSLYKESITIQNLTSNSSNNDFVAVKMGDVDGDASPSMKMFHPEGLPMALEMAAQPVRAGEILEIPLRVRDFRNKAALQLGLHLDTEKLELLEVRAENEGAFPGMRTVVGAGEAIKALWVADFGQPMDVADGTEFLRLRVRARQDLRDLASAIRLDDQVMENAGCNGDNSYSKVALEVASPAASKLTNRPNPFAGHTTIAYDLPEQAQVSVAVYDVTGKAVAQLRSAEMQEAGHHEIDLDASAYGAGIYFCKVTAGHSVMARRMVVTE